MIGFLVLSSGARRMRVRTSKGAVELGGHVCRNVGGTGQVGGGEQGQKRGKYRHFDFPALCGKLPSSCVQLVQGALVGLPQHTCGLWVLFLVLRGTHVHFAICADFVHFCTFAGA